MSDDTTVSRRLLRLFLAAVAYRTQKALRGAPAHYAEFRAGGTRGRRTSSSGT